MTHESDREADWRALHDPATDAAELARIAGARSEFASEVAAHPNAYPALQEWAHQVTGAFAASHSEPGSEAESEHTPKVEPDAAQRASVATSRAWSKRKIIAITVVGILLVIGVVVGIMLATQAASASDARARFEAGAATLASVVSDVATEASTAHDLLAQTEPSELNNPSLLSELQRRVDDADALESTIPAIASDAGAIAAQASELDSSARAAAALLDDLRIAATSVRNDIAAKAAQQAMLLLAPGEDWSVMGDLLVEGSVSGSGVADRVSGVIGVFTPETGPFEADASDLLPGEEVIRQTWTVAGAPGVSYLVGLVEVRVPASGLEPEYWVSSMLAVGVRDRTGEVLARTEVVTAACDSVVIDDLLAGSYSDAAAIVVDHGDVKQCGSDERFAAGINPLTGAELWRATLDYSPAAAVDSLLLVTDVDPSDRRECTALIGVDVASGATLFSYRGDEHQERGTCGRVIVVDNVSGGASYDNQEQRGGIWSLGVADDSDGSEARSFSSRTGAPLSVRQPIVLYDAGTGYAVASEDRYGLDAALEVYDTVTGETVYSMDAERVESLEAEPRALIDGVLYIDTTDQRLAIEVTTGVILSEAVDTYPISIVGEFQYLTNGTLSARG